MKCESNKWKKIMKWIINNNNKENDDNNNEMKENEIKWINENEIILK